MSAIVRGLPTHARSVWLDAAEESLRAHAYGDTITREWLEATLGFEVPAHGSKADFARAGLKFLAAFSAFREHLLVHHQRSLQAIGHGCYRIVPPHEQAETAHGDLVSAVTRELRKAELTVRHTNTKGLSHEQLRAHHDAEAKLGSFRLMASQSLGLPSGE